MGIMSSKKGFIAMMGMILAATASVFKTKGVPVVKERPVTGWNPQAIFIPRPSYKRYRKSAHEGRRHSRFGFNSTK